MMEFGVFDHVDRNSLPLSDYYEQRLQLVEAYDRHGFYGYHVAEHHSTPLGMASSPSVYLSAVAQRTRQLRFGPLVYLLPFYHPLRLIEEICILDQMSQGRLQVGVGRGISPFEAGYYGLNPETTREEYEDTLQILLKGLTQSHLTHTSKTHRFDNVPMELTPFQKPHPPLWMGVSSIASAEKAASQGVNIVSLMAPAAMRPVAEAYYNHRAPGHESGKVGLSFFIVVAEDDAAAHDEAGPAYAVWHKSFNYLYALHGRGPMLGAQPESFAALEKAGRGIAGSPATVADFLSEAIALSGVNYIVGQFAFGTMSHDATLRSIKLFAEEVMPAVRGAVSVNAAVA